MSYKVSKIYLAADWDLKKAADAAFRTIYSL